MFINKFNMSLDYDKVIKSRESDESDGPDESGEPHESGEPEESGESGNASAFCLVGGAQ